jgi:cell division cycle protein 20 (cofactor of APC complex)
MFSPMEKINPFEAPIDAPAAVVPRWKRKALEKCDSNTPTSTPGKAIRTNAGNKTPGCDRFIPNRGAMDLDVSAFNLEKEDGESLDNGEYSDEYDKSLNKTLLNTDITKTNETQQNSQVLAFRKKAPAADAAHQSATRVLYTANREAQPKKVKSTRYISQTPERILDAPELLDDYYLNLLDWSDRNVLAIALGPTVYMWNATDGSIAQLCELEEGDHVTSVSWGANGQYLAVGTDSACVQLWDVDAQRQLRNMQGHDARVGALSWNSHVVSSGSRDTTIINHDVRIAEHKIATLTGHTQEVCGLKWSPNGMQLASGGNDNLLNIWDAEATGYAPAPKFTMNAHQAAVKALAWCPWQENTLASGGGTADRCIKFWNTQSGALLNSVDTKSQVCSLVWSPHERELLSSHGFSQNQLTVWKFPQMTKVTELTGHTSRVLHTALSADGTTVVSAAADETLRFWKVFGTEQKASKKSSESNVVGTNAARMSIR